jgi:hypothetical protein
MLDDASPSAETAATVAMIERIVFSCLSIEGGTVATHTL